MNRPKITPQEAAEYFAQGPERITRGVYEYVRNGTITKQAADDYLKGAVVEPTEKVKVLAIRGYFKNTMGKAGVNDIGIFDDAFVVIAPGYFKTFNANTDPRKRGFGIFTLLPGLHYFKPGPHGFKNGPYPAFRTANKQEQLPGVRDGKKGIQQGVTINMHSGGDINVNSIGCQTVKKQQWHEYQTELYKLLEDNGQKVLPYYLIVE